MSILYILLFSLGITMNTSSHLSSNYKLDKEMGKSNILKIALLFAFTQVMMLLIGYFLGLNFKGLILVAEPFASLILFIFLGSYMIYLGFKPTIATNEKISFSLKYAFLEALNISVDTFVIGIMLVSILGSFSIWISAIIFFLIDFILSIIILMIGRNLNSKFEKGLIIAGGIILIVLGIIFVIMSLI